MNDSLKNRFLEFILQHQLFELDDRLLIAVSGGVDSMVLLHLLLATRRRLKLELSIVHMHHGIRGDAADRDMQLVKETAQEYHLPLYEISENVPEMAYREKLSVEEAGHRLRKERFAQLAQENNLDKIATAHHMDDQAETILMRLLLGTGMQGLAGIRLKNGKWVRPLLFASRDDIEEYASFHQIAFNTDTTNTDRSYLRNRIRAELIPLLKSGYNPEVSAHLANFSMLFQEWDTYLEAETTRLVEKAVTHPRQNKIRLDITKYNLYFSWIKIRVLGKIIADLTGEPFHVSFVRYQNFSRWIEKGKNGSRFQWNRGIDSVLAAGGVTFYKDRTPEKGALPLEVFPGGKYRCPGNRTFLSIEETLRAEIALNHDKNVEYVDGRLLKFPLYLRFWKSGDRFVPLGFQHSRLVSDFLTDCKVGMPERKQVAVLLSGDEIVWIIGYRLSDMYKIQAESKEVYRLTLTEEGS